PADPLEMRPEPDRGSRSGRGIAPGGDPDGTVEDLEPVDDRRGRSLGGGGRVGRWGAEEHLKAVDLHPLEPALVDRHGGSGRQEAPDGDLPNEGLTGDPCQLDSVELELAGRKGLEGAQPHVRGEPPGESGLDLPAGQIASPEDEDRERREQY